MKSSPATPKEVANASAGARVETAQTTARPTVRGPDRLPASGATAAASSPVIPSQPAVVSPLAASGSSPATIIASSAVAASESAVAVSVSAVAGVPAASTAVAVEAASPTAVASPPSAAPDEQEARGEPAPEQPEEAGPTTGTASADAILQKAMEYHEVGSFKKMLALLDEHQDLVGEMPETAALRLEQFLSDPQPDYRLMRSAAGIILQHDGNDPNANYAMGLYWSSLKKPDLAKALQHLALAKNAKKAPSGAASLYWRSFAKKYWYLFLLPLVVVAAAIDRRRKGQAGPSPVESAPESGWRSRLSSLAEHLKKLAARFRRRPPPPPGAPPDEGPGQGA